jgi:hypothetical protein
MFGLLLAARQPPSATTMIDGNTPLLDTELFGVCIEYQALTCKEMNF